MKTEVKKIDLKGLKPFDVFLRIPPDAMNLTFLSSDGTGDSRWSILGWNPSCTISYDGNDTFLNFEKVNKGFSELFSWVLSSRRKDYDGDLPFIGGAIGSIDFEYGYELLEIPRQSDGRKLIEFHFYDQGLIYDHLRDEWFCLGEEPQLVAANYTPARRLNLRPSWDFQSYQKHFEQLKELIRIGEIYQACLTFPFYGELEDFNSRIEYANLSKNHPAPMAMYLENENRNILSLSPERFIVWDGKNIETKPIKGTRPRGRSEAEDEKFRRELMDNPKEAAELNMITDLLRNDLAIISQSGSVKICKHRSLQKCPTVWHTYSQIVAQTKKGIVAWDIVEAMFPGGSISGCPKKRAVEILKDLEGTPRGIYTGCLGYISDHGRMDLNIAIRTLEERNGKIQGSFGGGIVYDSLARQEYQECMDKAKPFL